MWRVGVDVGGTFTDLFAWQEETGRTTTSKVLTTKDDRVAGVLQAIDRAGILPGDIAYFAHGSTTATNALVERSYPRAALITTEGFRDTIEIGRQHRQHLYDPYQTKPRPIIPRRFRFTVPERMNAQGKELQKLDERAAVEVAKRVSQLSMASVAVAFINAYANGAHEERMREIICEHCPGVFVAISSDTRAKFRELGRFVTTVVRAVLLPIMHDYLERLNQSLCERGFRGSFLVLKSNGGMMGVELAKDRPEELIESGPAGGVAYASYLSQQLGFEKVIHTDMGGTTFDASIVEHGRGLVTHEYELEWDLPIIIPMLDIRSVGAGGGSIAWIDPGGSLRVGPRSAGAYPGPICYGMGGTEVTVTDANLLLGRLETTLGGKIDLDASSVEPAIAALGERLGLDALQTAEGIIAISCENMAQAIKIVLVDRGRDPRDFVLASFGGAGPMHACFIARSMNIPRVVVSAYAGVASAFGATVMDIRHDLEMHYYSPVATVDRDELGRRYNILEEQGRALVRREALAQEAVTAARSAQMRYVGQSYEVTTPVPEGVLDASALAQVVRNFHREHELEHGVASEAFEPAFVSLAVAAIGHVETPSIFGQRVVPQADFRKGERNAYFASQWIRTSIFNGEALQPGIAIRGPAIIEYSHSCAVLPPDSKAVVDQLGNLIIDVNA